MRQQIAPSISYKKHPFYRQLDAVLIDTKLKSEIITIMGDFNPRFGQNAHIKLMNVEGQFADSVETTEMECGS